MDKERRASKRNSMKENKKFPYKNKHDKKITKEEKIIWHHTEQTQKQLQRKQQ